MAEKWTVNSGNWSNPAIWNGSTLPGPGDRVTITAGHLVNFDVDMSGWASGLLQLVVNGQLTVQQSSVVRAFKFSGGTGGCYVGGSGRFIAGSPDSPITKAGSLVFLFDRATSYCFGSALAECALYGEGSAYPRFAYTGPGSAGTNAIKLKYPYPMLGAGDRLAVFYSSGGSPACFYGTVSQFYPGTPYAFVYFTSNLPASFDESVAFAYSEAISIVVSDGPGAVAAFPGFPSSGRLKICGAAITGASMIQAAPAGSQMYGGEFSGVVLEEPWISGSISYPMFRRLTGLVVQNAVTGRWGSAWGAARVVEDCVDAEFKRCGFAVRVNHSLGTEPGVFSNASGLLVENSFISGWQYSLVRRSNLVEMFDVRCGWPDGSGIAKQGLGPAFRNVAYAMLGSCNFPLYRSSNMPPTAFVASSVEVCLKDCTVTVSGNGSAPLAANCSGIYWAGGSIHQDVYLVPTEGKPPAPTPYDFIWLNNVAIGSGSPQTACVGYYGSVGLSLHPNPPDPWKPRPPSNIPAFYFPEVYKPQFVGWRTVVPAGETIVFEAWVYRAGEFSWKYSEPSPILLEVYLEHDLERPVAFAHAGTVNTLVNSWEVLSVSYENTTEAPLWVLVRCGTNFNRVPHYVVFDSLVKGSVNLK